MMPKDHMTIECLDDPKLWQQDEHNDSGKRPDVLYQTPMNMMRFRRAVMRLAKKYNLELDEHFRIKQGKPESAAVDGREKTY